MSILGVLNTSEGTMSALYNVWFSTSGVFSTLRESHEYIGGVK